MSKIKFIITLLCGFNSTDEQKKIQSHGLTNEPKAQSYDTTGYSPGNTSLNAISTLVGEWIGSTVRDSYVEK